MSVRRRRSRHKALKPRTIPAQPVTSVPAAIRSARACCPASATRMAATHTAAARKSAKGAQNTVSGPPVAISTVPSKGPTVHPTATTPSWMPFNRSTGMPLAADTSGSSDLRAV